MTELVALYGDDGWPTGEVVARAEMRARNLRHAATAIVVLDPGGRVYVHRRTDTKDVYPGCYDFAAGGVLQADDQTRYHAYCYECTWAGPIRWQPEEVAWGEWVTPERLVEMLDELPFVPDTVANLGPWLATLR